MTRCVDESAEEAASLDRIEKALEIYETNGEDSLERIQEMLSDEEFDVFMDEIKVLEREALDDECLNEYQEPLYEMATVGYDESLSIIVEVNPDSKRIGNEYFKVYDSSSKEKAKRVCRILFREPKYVNHRRGRGVTKRMSNWIMNSNERDALVKFLNKPSDILHELTVWQAAIVLFNNEKGLPRSKTMENFINDLKYPEYLPIDLPIPDYTKLKRP